MLGLPPVYREDGPLQSNGGARPAGLNYNTTSNPYGPYRAASQQPAQSTPAEAWVQRQLPFYEDRYTALKKCTMLVTTFNAGCRPPPPKEILQLLVQKELLGKASYFGSENQTAPPNDPATTPQTPEPTHSTTPMDFIIVGLQEVDMSASALWKEETETAQPWIQGFKAAVGADNVTDPPSATNPYYMLPPKQLVGLLLLFFVRKPLGSFIKEFSITSVATGAMSTLGNKGCVAMRFQMHKSSYCIINAHLAAGQEHVAKRNDDMHTILTSLDFNSAKTAPNNYQTAFGYRPLMAQDHDLVILLGDLNYRVDTSYTEGVAKAAEGDFDFLLRRDQLLKELANPHTSFRGFTDHTPTKFPPTYRYDIGTDNYDTSEKRRIPAYTDRVLHWGKNPRHRSVYLLASDVKKEVLCSDHKPYCCVLSIPYREEVPSLKQQTENELREKVNTSASLDRVSAAKISVDVTALDFGVCTHYTQRTEHSVTITNEGECVAVISSSRTTGRSTDSGNTTSDISGGLWLRCLPLNFEILPGESKTVVVECYLNRLSLSWTNRWEPFAGQPEKQLKSMLIFSVENGAVSGIECTVKVKPSIFCNSLNNLLKLGNVPCAEAYRMGPSQAPQFATVSSATGGGGSASVTQGKAEELLLSSLPRIPKEIWYLCEAILKRAATEKDLFTTDTEWSDVASVMEYLDTHSEPIPNNVGTPFALAQCLIDLLKNLQEPVIPFGMYKAALTVAKSGGKVPLYFVHEQLPAPHCNLFVYLMGFLRRLLLPNFVRQNELEIVSLAQIFSKILLIRPKDSSASATGADPNGLPTALPELRALIQQEQLEAARFIQHFLLGASSR